MEVIFTLEEIGDCAEKIRGLTAGHRVFAIHGEMGAGKTTFIHALCKSMGVHENITSPTYSIINQYMAATGETICHMDLYRLKDEEEAINSGVEDCLYSGNTCLVEWPERAPGILPDDALHIYIYVINAHKRKLVIGKDLPRKQAD